MIYAMVSRSSDMPKKKVFTPFGRLKAGWYETPLFPWQPMQL